MRLKFGFTSKSEGDDQYRENRHYVAKYLAQILKHLATRKTALTQNNK